MYTYGTHVSRPCRHGKQSARNSIARCWFVLFAQKSLRHARRMDLAYVLIDAVSHVRKGACFSVTRCLPPSLSCSPHAFWLSPCLHRPGPSRRQLAQDRGQAFSLSREENK